MSQNHCVVHGCRSSTYNKLPGVILHPCPTSNEMRNRWLHALKNKCALLDWSRSRVCSKHFEKKYFDSQRKLKDNAVPKLFPVINKTQRFTEEESKIDRALSKLSQLELTTDIRNSTKKLREPANFEKLITEDLKSRLDAPVEVQMWLLIKKQEHLNNRLLEHVLENKKEVESLKKKIDETKTSKKDNNQSVETYKYIVKCLQEKLATLEEQIEILTAVESR